MARVQVVVEVCDRCPVGREGPATRTEIISIGTSRWQLKLCEKHGSDLDREMFGWGRLGEQLEDHVGTAFRGYDVEQHRRTAELRAEQTRADRDAEPLAMTLAAATIKAEANRTGLPVSAGKWVFTQHAIERLSERNIRVIDALRAASQPKVQRPGRDRNVWLHSSEGVNVAVDRSTNRILTVSLTD